MRNAYSGPPSASLNRRRRAFYGALSHAASCDAAHPVQFRQHVEALTGHHKLLVQWAENCPENFENRAALVGAEMARLDGRVLEAEQLYEKAIALGARQRLCQQ